MLCRHPTRARRGIAPSLLTDISYRVSASAVTIATAARTVAASTAPLPRTDLHLLERP